MTSRSIQSEYHQMQAGRAIPALLQDTPWRSATDPGTVSTDANPVQGKTHANSKQ